MSVYCSGATQAQVSEGEQGVVAEEEQPAAEEVSGEQVGADAGARADQPVANPTSDDGTLLYDDGPAPFPVDAITLTYSLEDEKLPPLEALYEVNFHLLRTDTGYVGPRAEAPGELLTLDALFADGAVELYPSAVSEIGRAVTQRVIDGGVVGVYVTPDPTQMSPTGRDLRTEGEGLTLEVHAGKVTSLRTIASGQRIAFENRINNPKHRRIVRRSPVQPGTEESPSLIVARDLEDYVLRLNRHPGRRVDVAIGPGEGEDEAVLDYLVQENRPIRAYFQISNTGTEQTNVWRERFGLTDTQLTGHDDILSLEYATASFDGSQSLTGSYEAPFLGSERLRWRAAALYDEYQASDVGISGLDFNGDLAEIDGDLVYNIYQNHDFFVDVSGGLRYFDSRTENLLISQNQTEDGEGKQDFLVPRFGLSFERYRETSILDGSLDFEFSLPGATGVDPAEMERLGRIDPSRAWEVLRGNIGYSFYLEPVLAGGYVPSEMVLAHELAFSLRGQWAMNNRLIPTEEQVAGGLYSVRGYDESVAAGDTVVIGTVEYRFHLPRMLEPDDAPRSLFGQRFKYAPASPGGRPDWDLIARGFVDAARTVNSQALSFEDDETLVGAGVGLELVIKRNLSVRTDFGVALTDLDSGEGDAGDYRLHVVATFLY